MKWDIFRGRDQHQMRYENESPEADFLGKKTPFDPKFFPAWVDSKLRFAKVLGSPLVALRHGKE